MRSYDEENAWGRRRRRPYRHYADEDKYEKEIKEEREDKEERDEREEREKIEEIDENITENRVYDYPVRYRRARRSRGVRRREEEPEDAQEPVATIGQIGPVGPMGPQGPRGPQGPGQTSLIFNAENISKGIGSQPELVTIGSNNILKILSWNMPKPVDTSEEFSLIFHLPKDHVYTPDQMQVNIHLIIETGDDSLGDTVSIRLLSLFTPQGARIDESKFITNATSITIEKSDQQAYKHYIANFELKGSVSGGDLIFLSIARIQGINPEKDYSGKILLTGVEFKYKSNS